MTYDKPLKIVFNDGTPMQDKYYGLVLAQLAQAEATLVRAGKDSAMPHFIAIVKEIERKYNFTFQVDE